MKKKILSCLLCLLLIAAAAIPARANSVKVVDNAGLFTADELAALEEKAQSVVSSYEVDVVILTVPDLEGKTAQAYADDYYDENGYGIGNEYSGVLFLIAMETREWYMSTCGDGIYALTDYAIEEIFSQMSYSLSNGAYYQAFDVYLDTLPAYFDAYLHGEPIDGYAGDYDGPGTYEPGYAEETVYYTPTHKTNHSGRLVISLIIGMVAAMVAVLVMASRMKTAKAQHGAGSYLTEGTYRLHTHQDLFLYSRVRKIKKPENNGGGHGGGGSSVHRSSGGRSHGGGGGRF